MIVGIDCYKLQKSRGKSIGIYNYARILVEHLAGISDRGYELLVFGNKDNRVDMEVPGLRFIEYDTPRHIVKDVYWELYRVKCEAKLHRVDLMIYPRGFIPLSSIREPRSIAVIHDLIPFYYHENYPGYFNRIESLYVRSRLKYSAINATKVLTISNFSRQQIVDFTGRSDIDLIYNTFGKNLHVEKRHSSKSEKTQIPSGDPYLFAITSGLPHKNASGIIDCYRRYLELGGKTKLYVVGCDEQVKSSVELLGLKDKVNFLSFVPDEELHDYMANASVFLFLSEIEGFGYPPIEAMSLGTPVVSSKGGALAEVVADGGLLVDNASDAAKAILSIEQDVRKRKKMVDSGYENIKRFKSALFVEKFNGLIKNLISSKLR